MKASDASCIAGFLDGDGSIHFQLVRQREYRFGFYIRARREHVRRALRLLLELRPRLESQEFLRLAREVDAFSTLNYSKTKRITAADVEQHLRSMGSLVPVTTSPVLLDRGDGSPADNDRQIYETHNTPAPRNGVKV